MPGLWPRVGREASSPVDQLLAHEGQRVAAVVEIRAAEAITSMRGGCWSDSRVAIIRVERQDGPQTLAQFLVPKASVKPRNEV